MSWYVPPPLKAPPPELPDVAATVSFRLVDAQLERLAGDLEDRVDNGFERPHTDLERRLQETEERLQQAEERLQRFKVVEARLEVAEARIGRLEAEMILPP